MTSEYKKNGYGRQDGEYFHVSNILNSLKQEIYGGEGIMMQCPMCEFYDVLINTKKTINTVKCNRCHAKQKWRLDGSHVKVKVEGVGIFYATNDGFTNRDTIYD